MGRAYPLGPFSGPPTFPARLPVTISESELKGRSRRRACSSSVFAKGNDVAHRVHSGSPAAKVRGVRLGNPNGARALPGKQVGNADVMAKINANASLRLRTSRALSRPKEPQGPRFRGIATSTSRAFKRRVVARGTLQPSHGYSRAYVQK